MRSIKMRNFKYFLVLTLFSCANVIMPTGGEKDIQPPKVLNTSFIKEDNIVTLQFNFDEYIQINNWNKHFYISPPIEKKVKKKIKGKSLILKIEDTLFNQSTYSICLNSCIKDLNEGNILFEYSHNFSLDTVLDTMSITGSLQDAYTLDSLESAAILLYDTEIHDSLIFKVPPSFIARTDKNGNFNFSNLDSKTYNIFAHQDFDYKYSNNKKIAFLNNVINAKKDSFLILYAFEPILHSNTFTDSSLITQKDTINKPVEDSSQFFEKNYGNLELVFDENNACVIQLISDDKVIKEKSFLKEPYIIKNIPPASYRIKYIYDLNSDGIWNTGDRELRTQPEQVIYYPNSVNIRENWDLVLDWFILK